MHIDLRRKLAASFLVLAGTALGIGLAPACHSSAATAAPSAPAQPASAVPNAASAALRVRGTGLKDLALSMADLKSMPHRTITVKDKDEKSVTYSGVLVEDILTKAGMGFGQALRGPKMRDYVLAEAGDGYGVVFALPENSTEFSDRVVIVAYAADGNPLSERDGPLKVVVSDEKKHARWVRNVTSLSIHTSAAER